MRVAAKRAFLFIGLVIAELSTSRAGDALMESERVEEYQKRNYSWPLNNYVPNTRGWRDLMEERLAQFEEMEDAAGRYQGYYQTIYSAASAPNFTEFGFGLAKCPDDLLAALQKGIHDGLPTAALETQEIVNAPLPPLFINRYDLTKRVLTELHSYAEEWASVPLTAHQAYGFRLYRNQSQLYMHIDRIDTHVISFILHIDSSEDSEPWPIFIEDFHGRTHEVILTPGDVLFYESSKCLHGRPRPLNGSWYTSVFVHYYPKYDWIDYPRELEAHYAVPPLWAQDPPTDRHHRKLAMVGTSIKEPDCPDEWCRTLKTVKWGGPAEEGYLITPAFEKIPFNPRGVDDEL